MSYYDVDAILTDAQKVPSTFALNVPTLGYLTNNPSGPLKAQTTLPLPLWLSILLAVSSPTTTPLLSMSLPASLSPRVLSALRADPLTVDLRALSPHFFALGCRVLDLFEEDEILDVLEETWRVRAGEIADFAGSGSAGGQGGEDFLRGLEEGERALFRVAHEGSKAVKAWLGEMKK